MNKALTTVAAIAASVTLGAAASAMAEGEQTRKDGLYVSFGAGYGYSQFLKTDELMNALTEQTEMNGTKTTTKVLGAATRNLSSVVGSVSLGYMFSNPGDGRFGFEVGFDKLPDVSYTLYPKAGTKSDKSSVGLQPVTDPNSDITGYSNEANFGQLKYQNFGIGALLIGEYFMMPNFAIKVGVGAEYVHTKRELSGNHYEVERGVAYSADTKKITDSGITKDPIMTSVSQIDSLGSEAKKTDGKFVPAVMVGLAYQAASCVQLEVKGKYLIGSKLNKDTGTTENPVYANFTDNKVPSTFLVEIGASYYFA